MDLFAPVKAQWISRVVLFICLAFMAVFHVCLLMPGVDAGIQMYGGLLINKGYEPHHHLWNNKPTLIYVLAAAGFFVKSNPFLGVRIIELLLFIGNLFLIRGIVKAGRLKLTIVYQLSFCAFYFVSWDEGFLPEVFNIPLVLLTVYFFLIRIRYFELLAALFMLLSFMLKQNAFAVIGGIMLLDTFTNYRQPNSVKKIIQYALALAIWASIGYAILHNYDAWDGFLYQAITYNSLYADRLPFFTSVISHIRHNSFLSVKGVSLILVFNACMLVTLYRSFKKRVSFQDKFMLCAILVYIPSYIFTYISGKSHPHYYMLLIVPATFIFGRYVTDSIIAKIALVLLLVYGVYKNVNALKFNNDLLKSRTEIAEYIKQHTTPDDPVHFVGLGNQYMYIMADRLSNTKFIIPIFENHGYTEADKEVINRDFTENLPKYIVTNKTENKPMEGNFYFEKIREALLSYHSVMQNDRYIIYQRTY